MTVDDIRDVRFALTRTRWVKFAEWALGGEPSADAVAHGKQVLLHEVEDLVESVLRDRGVSDIDPGRVSNIAYAIDELAIWD